MLAVLSDPHPQLYEEAVDALSQLGDLALDGLIAALDVPQGSAITQRVGRAILGMDPFPGEQLVNALGQSSDVQAQQMMAILKTQGADAAQILVKHLLHKDELVRSYVYQMLYEMPGPTIVPALLEVLNQPALRKVVNTILLKYPDAAIVPLVDLLGEHERGDAAAIILPQFGTRVLRSLISGLDDPRSMARERAQRIIVSLVRQGENEQDILSEVVQLFNPPLPVRARELLLDVLTNELADVSIPVLQDGLEDAYLLEDVSDAYVRLARKGTLQNVVLDNLVKALYVEERRRGAEIALLKIGAPVVQRVGELIVDPNQAVAKAAKQVLREIGVPALSFIWTAHSDKTNTVRRDAALEIFHSMRTDVIKDELVALLVSEEPDDIAMAVALLLERIHDEDSQRYADRVMIPELIEYVQTNGVEETNLRVISLLLLLGEHAIFDHLVHTLDDYPQHRKQLIYVLLLLGTETQGALLDVFNDPATSAELRAEIAAVLGMMMAPDEIAELAQNLSNYGVSPAKTGFLQPEQLTISLRALGGLLAGGHWHARKLQELRNASEEGSPEHELFSILLGWRYEPRLAKLQSELQNEQEAHRKEVMALTERIVTDHSRLQALTEELEQVHREHGFRGDELHQAMQERETLRVNLDQAVKEYNALRVQLQRALQENQALYDQNQQMIRRINQSGAP